MNVQRVGSAGAGVVETQPEVGPTAGAAPPKPPSSEGATVEQHPGAASSEGAQAKIHEAVGAAIHDVARKHPDPTNAFGQVSLNETELRHGALGKALATQSARRALGQLTDSQLQMQMEQEVSRAWPSLQPAEKQHVLAQKLCKQVREAAKYDAAFRMRDAAVEQLNDGAAKLEEIAKDPKKLRAVVDQLTSLPYEEMTKLRNQLGIDDPSYLGDLEGPELSARLSKRAALMRHEAFELARADSGRIFRAMADHDASELFMKKAGIEPGSVAAVQVRAAREQGKSDKADVENMKSMCAIAGALAAGPFSMLISAPLVYERYQKIDSARAGESAGTMKPGAVDTAKHNFKVSAATLAAEAVAGGKAAKGIEHLTHLPAPLAEGVVAAVAQGTERVLSKEHE